MGVLHAAYGEELTLIHASSVLLMPDSGIGAFASPLAATQFAQLPRWSFHYLISLGIAITNAISLMVVFRFKTQQGKSYLLGTEIAFI
jgi:hypothetical protein